MSFICRNGKIVDTIKIPAPTVSGITFGGPKRDILFVTTTRILYNSFAPFDSPNSSNPAAGQTFMVTGLKTVGRCSRRVSNYF